MFAELGHIRYWVVCVGITFVLHLCCGEPATVNAVS